MKQEIDIVITWVDGNDPKHKARLAEYSREHRFASCPDVGGATRFANVGEISYCLASINRYMRFVRKIFIVTDGQDPKVNEFLATHFESLIPIEIVDHKDIFKGYEDYLPTFNSRSIEAMLWRIPGLSERFIYLNDDFLLIDECHPEDFFIDDKVVCYAEWRSVIWSRLLRLIKAKKGGHKPVSFKESMMNALSILGGGRKYLYLSHAPRALKRSFYEDFFSKHPEVLIRNIRHRFRDSEQYNSQELFYISEYRKGQCIVESPWPKHMYMTPKGKKGYVEAKLNKFDRNTQGKFCCFNALDKASPEDLKMVLDWMNRKVGL